MATLSIVEPERSKAIALASRVLPTVLAVTSELPWPLDSGGHLRSFHLLRTIAKRTRLQLLVPIRHPEVAHIDALSGEGIEVIPVPIARRNWIGEACRYSGARLRREPYVLYRRHAWQAMRRAFSNQVRSNPPDLLYLDHLDSFLYRHQAPSIPAVLDLHNVYSLLAERMAGEPMGRFRRLLMEREANSLRRIETKAVRSVDVVQAVSDQEAEHFRSLGARTVRVVPNGVDIESFADLPAGRSTHSPIILFVGALSWRPNVMAARLLANEVLPRIRQRIPDTRLHLVGRDPMPEVRELSRMPGVEVFANVPEVKSHFARASLLAVPLEAGGGTRLKILEAFAAGLPVVSTPIGCEGIDAVPDRHLLVAGSACFADAVADLLSHPQKGRGLAEAARSLACERYDWSAVGARSASVIEQWCVARTGFHP